jgi:acetylornithine aminotransferase
MMANYATPEICLDRGDGAWVWDVEGTKYLDLIAGIATSTLGHANPAITAAVSEHVSRLAHTSNLFAHERGLDLAEKLVSLTGQAARVFFSQDGASANEAAYKLARRHGWESNPDGSRLEIVAAHGSFHGRTMGALSITGSPPKQDPFVPLPGPVTCVPHGDAQALRDAVSGRTAAVFLEPVLGEGGVIPAPVGYLTHAREICDDAGSLLVVDEVQSGIGRAGTWFMSLDSGVVPDVLTLAKGLAGGLPLGACLAFGDAASLFRPGDHGSTFGGNPVSCAAALAVINTIEDQDVLLNVKTVGEHWASRFDALDHPNLLGHRGVGLWRALVLEGVPAAAVQRSARDQGFLINAVAPDAIRLAPPLTLSLEQADLFAEALPRILTAAAAGDGQ